MHDPAFVGTRWDNVDVLKYTEIISVSFLEVKKRE